jgi:HlyD family secretion protein
LAHGDCNLKEVAQMNMRHAVIMALAASVLGLGGCTTTSAKKAMNKPTEADAYSGFDPDAAKASKRKSEKPAAVKEDTDPEEAVNTLVTQLQSEKAAVAVPAEEQLKLVEEGPRQEQIAQARAALAQARERFVLVKKGPRRETIDQGRARLDQAKQALALAETRLGYATVGSPLSGVVLSKNVEPGEYVAAGTPIVTVGDLQNVWVRAYINETDLGRVKVGQRVHVSTDTYPGKRYEGRVSFIASQAEFTPKNVQTEKERVKLVYRVKIDIRNPNMELKPGMPADGEILTAPGGS